MMLLLAPPPRDSLVFPSLAELRSTLLAPPPAFLLSELFAPDDAEAALAFPCTRRRRADVIPLDAADPVDDSEELLSLDGAC